MTNQDQSKTNQDQSKTDCQQIVTARQQIVTNRQQIINVNRSRFWVLNEGLDLKQIFSRHDCKAKEARVCIQNWDNHVSRYVWCWIKKSTFSSSLANGHIMLNTPVRLGLKKKLKKKICRKKLKKKILKKKNLKKKKFEKKEIEKKS